MRMLARAAAKRASLLVRRMKPKPVVTGYVELFDSRQIAGWALSRKGGDIDLALSINGSTYPLATEWVERADVSMQFGQQYLNAGFHCALPPDVIKLMQGALRDGTPLRVVANKVALNILCPLPQPTISLKKELLNLKLQMNPDLDGDVNPRVDSPTGELESWGHFVIHGWIALQGVPAQSICLLCNGKQIDCAVLRVERPDIIQSTEAEARAIGCEIELPGYIWEQVAENDDLNFTLLADGRELNDKPLILSREKATIWINGIAVMEEGQEKQYMSLLALEHIRYSGLFERVGVREQQYYRDFAHKMQLDEFLGDTANRRGLHDNHAYTQDINTVILWRMLRELNNRLADDSETTFEHVKATQLRLQLAGVVKDSFHHSVIPLLCRHDQFRHMRDLADFGKLYNLEHGKDAWTLSLSIAPLVADLHINRAADVLWRLSKQLSNGWLNTECLHYSVRQLQKLERRGEVDLPTAERFRYAFIGLLDGFKGDWYSRLHDQELVDASISLVMAIARYTDYHRRDVVNAIIRHYGLNPVFWQRLSVLAPDLYNADLAVAGGHWQTLHSILTNREQPLAEQLNQLLVPLRYFQGKGNPDTNIFVREIISNTLPEISKTTDSAGLELIQRLLDNSPLEALRFAAYPLPGENRLQSQFPEMQIQLYDTLRHASEWPASVVYELQTEAAACLRRAQSHSTNNKAGITVALEELKDKATGLANGQGMFLGADLLAQGLVIANTAGENVDSWILKLDEVIRNAINESKGDSYLPAPVCIALSRLMKNKTNQLLEAWLLEIRIAIESKFGRLHDGLFSEPEKKQLMPSVSGWPHDTLVVIYSCRKYLDTRVAAIRESWVKDLVARRIPYVVLVGDGDDTLKDDVLALNVSDTYEDLPKKTLRMFEWVFHNTNALYVLKIDDDCYLDVAEYFDSLSYRKHFYYGRDLSRAVGNMDRTWHHAKSTTLRAIKAIDKSPEPSIYADGGGGYCLSRTAIQMLIEAEKTEYGQRLMACSFMEDKLVGDLLASVHIVPSNEDYECYQRRRTFNDAIPVGMWENTFYPSSVTPTKVVHLDTHLQQQFASTTKRTNELWPKKIWPTCGLPCIHINANQLELLTSLEQQEKLRQNEIFVISVVRNEMIMLPHFLAHYRKLGVASFVFIDNCSDDGTREYLYQQPDVILYSCDTEYKYSHYGVAWQQAVLGNLCLNKWVLLADADELLVYEDFEQKSLPQLLQEIENDGENAMRTDMVDMYPYGDLSEADFTKDDPFEVAGWFDMSSLRPWRLGSGWFSNMESTSSNLRHRLAPHSEPHAYVSQKYALFRYYPWLRLSQGIHYQSGMKVCEAPAYLAHFKYHAGFKEKVMVEVRRKQHYNNALEYNRYLQLLAEREGGFGDPDISVKYQNSKSLCNL